MKKGFTLAEILITLGIIGVVAAITIPTLVNNYQKSQYVTGLQKTFAILNAAFKKYAADQGCNDMECTGLFSDTIAHKQADWDDFFNNYLKVIKNCGLNVNQGCFPTEAYFNAAGTETPDNSNTYYKVVLSDGQSIGFQLFALNCNYYTTMENNPLYRTCARIIIDTNGMRGPNKSGRDYFPYDAVVLASTHFVVAQGGSNAGVAYCGTSCHWDKTNFANSYCGTAADSYGSGCASRIIEESWQMNY